MFHAFSRTMMRDRKVYTNSKDQLTRVRSVIMPTRAF